MRPSPGCSTAAGTSSARRWRRSRPSGPTTCEARHCVGVGNGLDALILALRALDIGPGDEVIVPSNTYIATWLAVSRGRARRPCRSSPTPPPTISIPPGSRRRSRPRTRAILPVHLYGQPADLDPILAIARAPRAARGRGRGAGAWRALQGPADRRAWRCGLLELLSGQEPRRAGRCRRGHHRSTPISPSASACCATTARREKYVNEVQGVNSPARPDAGGGAAGQAGASR